MTTIRERIETGGPDNTKWNLLTEWTAGNLVPADEVDARIAEAVAGERERCARIVEGQPAGEGWRGNFRTWPCYGLSTFNNEGIEVSLIKSIAAAIRGARP